MKHEYGFTLVELLIVVAILGVLAVVIIPNLSNMIGAGDLAAANTEADSMRTAVLAYHTEARDWPDGDYSEDTLGVLDDYIDKTLRGSYSVGSSGEITGVGGWPNLEWQDGKWVKSTD